MKPLLLYVVLIIMFLSVFGYAMGAIDFSGSNNNTVQQTKPKIESKPKTQKQDNSDTSTTINQKDTLSLSMKSQYYYSDSELRNILSQSDLEYCSRVDHNDSFTTLVWILKSNNKEVYSCNYSYNRQRKTSERSKMSCQIKEGYQDYLDGDRLLYRDYIMPTANDEIEMAPNYHESYFQKYFILGKYSDMTCSVKGNDIYCTYYWYQNTDKGPMLVYTSNATNNKTTSGHRYNSWLWQEFEESYKNIDIIPYQEYPRAYDYEQVYEKWYQDKKDKNRQEELKQFKDMYCVFEDAEDLFYEFPDDFEYFEDAESFFDDYCE